MRLLRNTVEQTHPTRTDRTGSRQDLPSLAPDNSLFFLATVLYVFFFRGKAAHRTRWIVRGASPRSQRGNHPSPINAIHWIGFQHFPSCPKQPFVGLGFADQMVFSAPRGSGWTDSGFRRHIHKVHLGLFLRHWLDLVTRNRYVAFLRLQSPAPRTITCTVCSSIPSNSIHSSPSQRW